MHSSLLHSQPPHCLFYPFTISLFVLTFVYIRIDTLRYHRFNRFFRWNSFVLIRSKCVTSLLIPLQLND